MTRSNLNKRKPRAAQKTLLIYGEGSREAAFINYLKRLYARNSGIAVTANSNNGGAPIDIVSKANKYSCDFDYCAVIIDNDREESEVIEAKEYADANSIEVIQNTPCLEATLLSIFSPQQSFENKSSQWCKKEFEKEHIRSEKRGDPREYEKVFPKSLLDKHRLQIPELDRLIALIDGTADCYHK